ncbi:MAG: 3-oxoacyl-[Paludibacteraceae bacterium]|nr:3-oxoacyl-[acyl-carrier-protein] reductase [Paludibacteraceae bacterium]MBR2493060.1 3-oxoacyl-[acyl-carrier-protein] reductase [Paludibacteraceae bacterium]MBR3872024.1 3-oxoacyl-[acyl-carrier-protein] reductase [Paludibacteraceae bacterium]MBR6686862.1 3-oxoacyl-[acyl-carrier-protein] reductase [Paludibacteraceae bacterium]
MLKGKIALITGAAQGIGKGIALAFAKQGATVAFTVRKLDERSESLVNEITAMGGIAKAYASDAACFSSAADVVAEIMKDFGRIDVLVNNAGITKDGLLMRMTEEQWDMVINTNLKSAFNYIHAVTPIMMRQRSGSVINMTSIVGISGNAGQANYAASKAGLIGLTKSVAKELGGRNIRVNAIAPGFIATEMTGVLNEDMKKQWILNIPLHREGKVEDVAGVAVFLASDMSSYVSGQVINCCGGLNM